MLGKVARGGQCQPDDPALRRGIGRLALLAVEGGDGGGIDDHPTLRPGIAGHLGGGKPHDVERAGEVDVDRPAERVESVRPVAPEGLLAGGDAGAVDEDVDSAHRALRGGNTGGDRGLVGHVHHGEPRADPRGEIRAVGRAVEDRHLRAFVAERLRRRRAKAGRPAGDDRPCLAKLHRRLPI